MGKTKKTEARGGTQIPGTQTRPSEAEQTRAGGAAAGDEKKPKGSRRKADEDEDPGTRARFKVLTPFVEEGVRYGPGEVCELTIARAAAIGTRTIERLPEPENPEDAEEDGA